MDDDLVFKALADPTRRLLLDRLFERDGRTLTELEPQLEMTRFGVMKHLKVLEQAGLVSRSRRATARLSHLEAAPLREATAWLARYREYWEESYERLDELLAALQRNRTPSSASATVIEPAKARKPKRKQQEGRKPR
jgi:DNA-binding transcriptional ArsR family regulator